MTLQRFSAASRATLAMLDQSVAKQESQDEASLGRRESGLFARNDILRLQSPLEESSRNPITSGRGWKEFLAR